MIWIILIAIGLFVAYKIGSTSGEVIGSVNDSGGMSVKYATLIDHITKAHKDCKILGETRTYLRVGVSNYGGTTLFHIQQSTGNKVIIQYEVKNNPVVRSFQLEWTFPDNMDQNEMIVVMATDIQRKMMQG